MADRAGLVAVSTYGAGGASTRVRLLDWFAHLGLAPEVHNYIGTANNQPRALLRSPGSLGSAELGLRRLRSRIGDDTLLLSRQASPFSSGRLEEGLLRAAARGVYDFDDALYAEPPGAVWTRLWSKRSIWERSVSVADVVIAGSERLAEEASRRSSGVVVIPSCIEPDSYQTKADYQVGGVPRIVWIGSPATEQFLLAVSAPLLELHRRLGARLTVVSGASGDLGDLEQMVDRRPWSIDTFGSVLATGDVGIMPLPDNEFTRGKCSYKILQYAAAGVPVVGSPVGANRDALARLGGTGAGSADEWVSGIAEILGESSTRRAARGTAALRGVTEHYSFGAWADRWRAAVGV